MEKSYRAGGIVINREGKIALCYEHLWGFPRGGVEEGESYEEAARREIFEETGIKDLELVEDIGFYERYPFGVDKDTSVSYPMEIHIFIFTTEYTGEMNPLDKGVKETGWFTYEEVVSKLSDHVDRGFFESKKEEILEVINNIS